MEREGAERRGGLPAFADDMAGERPQGRKRALQRPAVDAFSPPAGKKGAKVPRRAIGEICDPRRRAKPLAKKGEKLPGVAAVSLDRALRQPSLAGEMAQPRCCRHSEVGRGGKGGGLLESDGRFIAAE